MSRALRLLSKYQRLENSLKGLASADVYTAPPQRYLPFFKDFVWPLLEPQREFSENWHHGLIAEYLEAVTIGQLLKVIFNLAPRSAKSREITVGWPCWEWLYYPYYRYLCLSYAQVLATDHNEDRRRIIQHPAYQAMSHGRCQLTRDAKNRSTEFQNNSRGEMKARGFDGSVTGSGGDRIIWDDPNNPEKVESDAVRESTNRKFRAYTIGRRDDPKQTAIVGVQQRTHEDDVTGMATAEEFGYEWVKLPTEAPVRVVLKWPISKRETVREAGELLHRERFGPEQVAEAKSVLGSYLYASLHGQEPAPAGGGLFKDHHWRFWQPAESDLPPVPLRKPDGTTVQVDAIALPSDLYNQCQSWDCTFKDEKTSDFVAGHVWAHRRPDSFLLDRYHERADIISTIAQIQAFDRQYPRATLKLIEDKANGPAVIQLLQSKVAGLKAVNPQGGKFARAVSAQPSVESGHTYLPHPAIAPWVWDFIGEHSKFPNGKNDDDVDAHTQFKVNFTIGIVRSRSGTVGYG